jgi:mannose-6-phosphate isomerase-like protein (cupin superfamily)
MPSYLIAQLDQIEPVECPCGVTRRAFVSHEGGAASLHVVDISSDPRAHYHRKLTEMYLVLEGEGEVELDGERVPVRPLTAVLIRPGCRHRAVGKLRVVVCAVPAFDPEDEWFD